MLDKVSIKHVALLISSFIFLAVFNQNVFASEWICSPIGGKTIIVTSKITVGDTDFPIGPIKLSSLSKSGATIKGKGFNYSLESVGHYENDSFISFRGRAIEYDPAGPIEYINYYDFDANKEAKDGTLIRRYVSGWDSTRYLFWAYSCDGLG